MEFLRRGIILGLLISPFSKLFATIPKPTLAPKKLGQTIIWRNRKYTAIKVGKNIVWDDGIEIKQILTTASPSRSPSASPSSTKTVSATTATPTPTNTSAVAASPTPTPNPTTSPSSTPNPNMTSNGILVAKSSELSLGQTKIFKDPNSIYGASYILTRTSTGVVAFDNTCTHSGCWVDVVLSNNQVRCTCHGSEFNATNGAVTQSPARTPLTQVKVSEINGEILIG